MNSIALVVEHRALGQEERAARRDRVDEEQLELPAEAAVVAPLRLFEAVQVARRAPPRVGNMTP